MNKILLVLLSIILFVLLAVTGTLFYAFSDRGNAALGTYIQEEAEEKIGLPVEVRKFTLEAGKSRLIMRINKEADVEVVTNYDILAQSFQGIYRVKANDFHYEKMVLREADIQGHFKGVAEDIVVDGRGTALDANLAYRFRVLDQLPKDIEANIKGIALAELLALAGQVPIVEGKIDVDIKMPDIGKEFASGYGHMVLDKAYFNTNIVQKMYDLTIPKKSYLSGVMDVKLKGNMLHLQANAKSNLFNLQLKDAVLDAEKQHVKANYVMDVKEMAILSQNKLSGPLMLSGNVDGNKEKYHITGATHSLGGTFLFEIGKKTAFNFENLELSKILRLTKQPAYAKGVLNGNGDIDKDLQSGRYDIHIDKGVFGAKSVEKHFGYQIPTLNSFSLSSKGKIEQKVLEADATLKSTLSDIKLTDVVYALEKKKLEADYDVFLPNIGLLMPNNKAVKRGYMSLKGEVKLDKTLLVKGRAKGLGEKLNFSYDGKGVTVDARNLFVEKLLSLSGLPRYVKGKLSSDIKVTNIKTLDGTFSFSSDKLVTQPNVMERLMGKKLTMQLALKSKGKLKAGIAYFDTELQTSMGHLKVDNIVFNTKNSTFKGTYVLDIPALEKTYALTEKKLYGPMVLKGNIAQDKGLRVTGSTSSLGGKIDYTLVNDMFNGKIVKVPVENILGLLGHKKLVQGDAYGDIRYNLKKKEGVVDLDIKAFQIKRSSTTDTVKMFIGKDPARIIYTSTQLHADIKGDVTRYTLAAKGSHSSITLSEGVIDKAKDTHSAKFKFVYEKYVVTGSIGGTASHPSIMVDPSSIMDSKAGEKIQKKLDKALGGDMGKAVGGFLKGFKF